MNLLLPIKPKYVKFMKSGEKTVELRKKFPKLGVNKIFVYESFPVKRICCYLKPTEIIEQDIEILWNKTKSKSCVTIEEFYKYYEQCVYGCAIFFDTPKVWASIPLTVIMEKAPQNYCYLSDKQSGVLLDLLNS